MPPKTAEVKPWNPVCVDLIGPYTLKGVDRTVMDFMWLMMINPATAWFKIVDFSLARVTCRQDGEDITEVIIDESYAQVSHLFNSYGAMDTYVCPPNNKLCRKQCSSVNF